MKNTTVTFTAPRVVELVESEIKPPKDDQIQVRLAVSTVSSGTERANLLGDANLSVEPGDTDVTFPRVRGYSSSGVVAALGKNVTDLQIGDRVALYGSKHRHFLNIVRTRAFPIGERVSFENAAIFYIATFPLAAIRKCRVEIGESAIVMGMGILGQCAVPLLRLAGAHPVIAVDPDPGKREKALRIGADFALDPFAPDFAETAKKLANGGAKVGIEVTGVGAGLDGILDCMARFGRVALLGCTRSSDFTIDYYHKVHGPGVTLIGAHTHARPAVESYPGWWTQGDDMKALIRLTDAGRLDLSALIDEMHSPAEAVGVYERLLHEKAFPLVQFGWRKL